MSTREAAEAHQAEARPSTRPNPLDHADSTSGEREQVALTVAGLQGSLPAEGSGRAAALLQMQRTIGNRQVQRVIQAALEVSRPGDPYEREADEVADRIVATPNAGPVAVTQRVPVPDAGKGAQPVGQGITRQGLATDDAVLPNADEAVSAAADSAGHPLPDKLQRKFEQALGVDLSGVRIHTGPQSVNASRAIGAKAYTVGNDVHFNAGRYDPDSAAGQRLLAHEVTHTVQQQAVPPVQAKLIQADPDPAGPAPAPTGGAAPTTVNTLWNINFIDQFAGTGTAVKGRGPATSLYVKQLKVAPEGEAGKPAPAPKIFAGVTLAPTGKSEMGSYVHPKDKGGKVSASVAYGDKPTFDFSISTVDYDPKTATDEAKAEAKKAKALNSGAAHKAVVKQLTDELDTFVDEAEAQAVLSRIVSEQFSEVSVEATIKMKPAKTTTPINTTDLNYVAVASDKTFNLVVKIPNVTKDKSSSYTTTKNKDKTEGEEKGSETGKEKGVATKTTVETEFIQSYESAFMSELKTAAEKVKTTANVNEKSTTHTGKMTVKNSTSAKLSGEISGGAELDLGKIPLAGKILGKLLNAKVNINLKPDLSDTFELEHSSVDEEAKKTINSESNTVRNELSTAMQTSVKNLWSSKLKTTVETSTHETTTEKTSEKKHVDEKSSESAQATNTSGSVTIVANAVQPVLSEE